MVLVKLHSIIIYIYFWIEKIILLIRLNNGIKQTKIIIKKLKCENTFKSPKMIQIFDREYAYG